METLGTATIICSDKTGTLTRNEMTVKQIFVAEDDFHLTGAGYQPQGEFLNRQGKQITPRDNSCLGLMLLGGLLCNDARWGNSEGNGYGIIGDPTEGALIVAAAKAGWSKEKAEGKYPRLAEIPFDSGRKLMTTFHSWEGEVVLHQGGWMSFYRPAPTSLPKGRKTLTGNIRSGSLPSMGIAAGERVLALALRSWPQVPAELATATVERELTLVGFFALQDPARPEATEAVEISRRAGIRTIMITGDHPETAAAIAQDLDILWPGDGVLTGIDLNKMNGKELQEAVGNTTVYARVSPEHKLKIIEALQKKGHVVAMTGDGVNDAPALKRADIGVAMGITVRRWPNKPPTWFFWMTILPPLSML